MSTLHMLVKRPRPLTSHITAVPHRSIDDVTQTFDFEQMQINTDFFTGMMHVLLPHEDVGRKRPLWHRGPATEAQTEEVWKGWLALNCFSSRRGTLKTPGETPLVGLVYEMSTALTQSSNKLQNCITYGTQMELATSVWNNNKATRRHQDRGWRAVEVGGT